MINDFDYAPRPGYLLAAHWLKEDYTAGNGREKAWMVGEERTHTAVTLVICERGYHSSPSLWDALEYAPGPVATLVEISEPEARQPDKYVSRTRKLICAVNVESELRQFAIDCAERALLREREQDREPDPRSWAGIEAAKAFLRGEITPDELAAAEAAARDVAWATAWAAAEAARDAEHAWQRSRFEELITPRIEATMKALGLEAVQA